MRVFINVEFFVRLDRSVHLDVGKTGFWKNAMTRSVLLKKEITHCKSGGRGGKWAFYSV